MAEHLFRSYEWTGDQRHRSRKPAHLPWCRLRNHKQFSLYYTVIQIICHTRFTNYAERTRSHSFAEMRIVVELSVCVCAQLHSKFSSQSRARAQCSGRAGGHTCSFGGTQFVGNTPTTAISAKLVRRMCAATGRRKLIWKVLRPANAHANSQTTANNAGNQFERARTLTRTNNGTHVNMHGLQKSGSGTPPLPGTGCDGRSDAFQAVTTRCMWYNYPCMLSFRPLLFVIMQKWFIKIYSYNYSYNWHGNIVGFCILFELFGHILR